VTKPALRKRPTAAQARRQVHFQDLLESGSGAGAATVARASDGAVCDMAAVVFGELLERTRGSARPSARAVPAYAGSERLSEAVFADLLEESRLHAPR
jgi:hypothetical protein